MTKAKTILVAVGAITGGTRRAKDAPFAAATLGDGEELTEQAATALGRPHAARTIVDTLLDDRLPPLVLAEKERDAIALAASRTGS